MPGTEQSGSPAENVHQVATIGRGKSHLGYWKGRLYRNVHTEGGHRRLSKHWCVKLQKRGRRELFDLGTSDATDAAKRAREIALVLDLQGWEEARARFKARDVVVPASEWTVGKVLEALAARSTLKPAVLTGYRQCLRRIAAGVAGAGLEAADKVRLSALSVGEIARWRSRYVESAPDPLRRKSAERSAAAYIRNARAIFKVPGMPASPFAGLRLKDPGTSRYASVVDAGALVAAARAELKGRKPAVYLAFLVCFWGGLRRREADLLLAEQLHEEGGQIRLRRSRYFDPKTEESERDVDLPRPVMAEILALRRRGAEFVLPGRPPKVRATYYHYRCRPIWRELHAWLRARGVSDRKPIHALRKESGSLIAQVYGIEAARGHLGHKDIQTTSAHYVTKKERREVTLSP